MDYLTMFKLQHIIAAGYWARLGAIIQGLFQNSEASAKIQQSST
jgi:hypothetical protein